MDALQRFITAAGVWLARPAAFGAVLVYAVLWLIFDRESLDFHGAVALITLCMTLFIQRSEHRDTQAIHAKLDEILRALGKGDSEITKIDHAEPEHIEARREGANVQDR
jgi:low affinity Fe/Cu permease